MKEIILAKHAGLCTGVERALSLALAGKVKPIWLLGHIAHNERIIRKMEDAGCRVIGESDLENLNEGSVVIRAHGVAPMIYEKLKKIGVEIIDATCPYVKKIHDIVTEYDRRG